MVRSRVLSFISAFGSSKGEQAPDSKNAPTASAPASSNNRSKLAKANNVAPSDNSSLKNVEPWSNSDRPSLARPASMAFTYQPPQTEIAPDTLPELLPIFTFMNSHSNKLYQEGYFLKLNDLDIQGRPCADRKWDECFAQLVGTVLSIWDAAALDAAGGEREIIPTFINLADASIKMLETLPTYDKKAKPLQNVLSVSTAGRNRYLFHFNSLHALTQWTAGIRLALFENTALLEAYTGSIIAGKGRELNNIRMIMERSRYKYEDWARVRFGAGTPWRRCWFVVAPPSDKEYQKLYKSSKKKSAYDRTTQVFTGDIKFYDTKKTKKAQPIATITNAYAAFAIYPQSKALIDQSTLVKIEGTITIHSQPQSTTEGFVFIMPELHAAVSGLEIMLRFLFPVFDTFNLYGRPNRLIADTNNLKSLMFAFPKSRKYGYLDVLDVVNLINKPGSQGWSEREWRVQLREATAQRLSTLNSPASSIRGGRQQHWSSLPNRQARTRFQEPLSPGFNQSTDAIVETPVSVTDSPVADPVQPYGHFRAISDTGTLHVINSGKEYTPTRLSVQADMPPEPPTHGAILEMSNDRPPTRGSSASSSDGDIQQRDIPRTENPIQDFRPIEPPAPVAAPPAFAHQPGEIPTSRPQTSSELRRANSRMSSATLAQMVDLNKLRVTTTGFSDIQEDPYSDERNLHRDINTDFSSNFQANSSQEQVPPVPIHAVTTETRLQQPLPQRTIHHPPNLHIDTFNNIKRKPLPPQVFPSTLPPNSFPTEIRSARADLDYEEDQTSALSSDPSLGDLQHTVDEAVLNRVLPLREPFSRSMTQNSRNDDESVYDVKSANDTRSISPDYASTRKSTDTKRSEVSIPRPRMGVLKTVGAPPDREEVTIGDAHYFANQEPPKENPDIPNIDFGPTMMHNLHTRGPSVDILDNSGTNRHSAARQVGAGEGHARKPSRSPAGDDKRRSVAWQPGLANYRAESPSGRPITAEEFVHQRTMSNSRLPEYPVGSSGSRPRSGDWLTGTFQMAPDRDLPRPHSRGSTMLLNSNEMLFRPNSQNPTTMLNQNEPSARPHSRGSTMLLNSNEMLFRPNSQNSTIMLNQNEPSARPHSRGSTMLLNSNEMPFRPHSQNSTRMLNQNEPFARPHSRGSGAVLNQNDITSHLSAREQEHIARMTGSSFFNFSQNKDLPAVNSGGLIGAIDAREREKRYMKEGLSNQLVQTAIAQRQQQQLYETQQSQHIGGDSIYNMPGASYTWDNFNQNTLKQPQIIPRPVSSTDWHAWNGPEAFQMPPGTQQPTHHFQGYQNY